MEHWIEIAIDTNPQGIDLVSNVLTALDLSGFVIEDETEFLTFLEENRSSWDYVEEALLEEMKGVSRIKLYVPETEAGRETLKTLRQAMDQLAALEPEARRGSLAITLNHVKNQDWEENWKAYYKPFPVGKRLYIVPEWERGTPPPAGRTPLYLNPGLMFGTGGHASTRLCLEALETHLHPGDAVLDLGSGSGILSVAALKLGAAFAAACDIDPKAEQVALENAARNHVDPNRYQVETGDVLTDTGLLGRLTRRRYRVVLSNIVADVILALAPQISAFLEPAGVWIGSGIIASRWDEVETALHAGGYRLLHVGRGEDWVCFAATPQNRQ